MKSLELRPLARADFPSLAGWLAQPHVARWWNHDNSLQAIERDFGPAIDGTDRAEVFIASVEGRGFGLLQRYTFEDNLGYIAELSPILGVPGAALSLDYFVGEAGLLRQGYGTAMLIAAVRSTWRAYPSAPAIVVPVAAVNEASRRLLVRAGFEQVAAGHLPPDNPIDDGRHCIYRIDRPA